MHSKEEGSGCITCIPHKRLFLALEKQCPNQIAEHHFTYIDIHVSDKSTQSHLEEVIVEFTT